MLPLRASVDLGAMIMRGVLCIPQSSSITGTSPSDCLVFYPGHSLGESYPSAEMQSVYSTAPGAWATISLVSLLRIFVLWYYLPTPPLGQDMTQGQFLSGV